MPILKGFYQAVGFVLTFLFQVVAVFFMGEKTYSFVERFFFTNYAEVMRIETIDTASRAITGIVMGLTYYLIGCLGMAIFLIWRADLKRHGLLLGVTMAATIIPIYHTFAQHYSAYYSELSGDFRNEIIIAAMIGFHGFMRVIVAYDRRIRRQVSEEVE